MAKDVTRDEERLQAMRFNNRELSSTVSRIQLNNKELSSINKELSAAVSRLDSGLPRNSNKN